MQLFKTSNIRIVSSNYAKNCFILTCQVFSLLVVGNSDDEQALGIFLDKFFV